MAEFEQWKFDATKFSGKVCLCPLPNLVVFPHVMQPLHIFEPRYRQMVDHAMGHDRLIGMAVLKPGWEKQYEGTPPIESIACLARITTCQPLADGRYNILVLGLNRIEIIRELPREQPFRMAEVRVLEDLYLPNATAARPGLQKKLVDAFKKIVPSLTSSQEQIDQLLSGDIPLGMLTDIVGYALGNDVRLKEQLLAECSVDRRAEILLAHLATAPVPGPSVAFPPDFSVN